MRAVAQPSQARVLSAEGLNVERVRKERRWHPTEKRRNERPALACSHTTARVARFGVRTQKRHEENAREWKGGKGTTRECSYADSLALGRPVASVFMGHESLI